MFLALFPHIQDEAERRRALAHYWPDVPAEYHENMAEEIDADDIHGFVARLGERIMKRGLDAVQIDWLVSELIFDVRDNSHMIRRQVFLLLHDSRRPWAQKQKYETPTVTP